MPSRLLAAKPASAMPPAPGRRAAGRAWGTTFTGRSIALIFALAVVVGHRCAAQGTNNLLPDPISVSDVLTWSDQLSLSPQQEAVAMAAHGEYRVAFQVLRDGDQQALLELWRQITIDMRHLVSERGTPGDRQRRLDIARDRASVMRAIEAADEAFITALAESLSQPQTEQLELLRLQRWRATRLRGNHTRMSRGAAMNVTTLLEEIDSELDTNQRTQVDRILLEYERTRSSATTEYDRRLFELFMAMPGAQDAERLAALRPAIDRVEQLTRRMRAANRKVISELRPFLPLLTNIELRDVYVTRSARVGPMMLDMVRVEEPAHGAVVEAAQHPGLDAEQAEAITALCDDYLASELRRLDQILKIIDAWLDIPVSARSNDGGMKTYTALIAIKEDRQHAARAATDAIDSLLSQIITAPRPGESGEQKRDDDVHRTRRRVLSASKIKWTLPDHISRQSFEYMLRVLGLEHADDRMIFELLYEDYEAAWELLDRETLAPAVELVETLWGADIAAQQWIPPGAAAVRRVASAIDAAGTGIADLDARFFASVSALLPDDAARRLHHIIAMRTHERLDLGYGLQSNWSLPAGSRFFIPTVLATSDIDVSLMDELDGLLTNYETTFLESLELQQKNHFEFRREAELIAGEWSRLYNSGKNYEPGKDKRRQVQEEAKQDYRSHAGDLVELNQITIDRMLAMAGGAGTAAIDRAWKLTVLPLEYTDANALHDSLRRALEMDDLTVEQHSAVSALATNYRVSYDALCDEMRRLREESPGMTLRVRFDMERDEALEVQRRADETNRVRFNRDDLSDLARHTLRNLLGPEQQRRAGVGSRATPG